MVQATNLSPVVPNYRLLYIVTTTYITVSLVLGMHDTSNRITISRKRVILYTCMYTTHSSVLYIHLSCAHVIVLCHNNYYNYTGVTKLQWLSLGEVSKIELLSNVHNNMLCMIYVPSTQFNVGHIIILVQVTRHWTGQLMLQKANTNVQYYRTV